MTTAYDRTEKRLRNVAESESTANTYMTDVRNFRDWLESEEDADLFDAEPYHINDYLFHQLDNFADTTVEGRLSALKMWYRCAEDLSKRPDRNFECTNPIPDISDTITEKIKNRSGNTARDANMREKLNHGIVYLEKDEIDELCQHVPAPSFRNKCIILTMAKTGVRRSEVVNMQMADFGVPDNWESGDPWYPDDNSIHIPGIKSDDRTVYYR